MGHRWLFLSVLAAEDPDDVLPIAEPPNDIQVVVPLEVEPLKRKRGHLTRQQALRFLRPTGTS
jgi:hypothetical protein